ncbi:Dehydrogenase/reductase SDR family member 7C-B [Liparis tanakae]|uniref:Dehydrogenase/reductase SDR family member 7C-B n=1 Tax=Liparis tanakae TaxID=230148 RepID=A0A4Z2GHP2_9TELE|nr:Dehydrogenase/reductase SDR family member 7C-B [Liparis tanakae]
MDSVWTTTVLLVPCVIVLTAGLFYLYSSIKALLSRTSVRNKVVVVTDALSGLGKECAAVFHRGGARLILCGKSWEELEELADDLAKVSDPTVVRTPARNHGTRTFPPKLVLLEFGDLDSMPEVVSEILECYGCLDVLIFNSSLKLKAPAQSSSLEMDKMLMDNNYFGPATLAKGLLPSMMSRRTGHLLLVNSIQGKLAVPFRTALLYTRKPLGVSPDEAASEIVKTLSSRRNEVVIAPSLPKVALYARSLFPDALFAVMAAGVKKSV